MHPDPTYRWYPHSSLTSPTLRTLRIPAMNSKQGNDHRRHGEKSLANHPRPYQSKPYRRQAKCQLLSTTEIQQEDRYQSPQHSPSYSPQVLLSQTQISDIPSNSLSEAHQSQPYSNSQRPEVAWQQLSRKGVMLRSRAYFSFSAHLPLFQIT